MNFLCSPTYSVAAMRQTFGRGNEGNKSAIEAVFAGDDIQFRALILTLSLSLGAELEGG